MHMYRTNFFHNIEDVRAELSRLISVISIVISQDIHNRGEKC